MRAIPARSALRLSILSAPSNTLLARASTLGCLTARELQSAKGWLRKEVGLRLAICTAVSSTPQQSQRDENLVIARFPIRILVDQLNDRDHKILVLVSDALANACSLPSAQLK